MNLDREFDKIIQQKAQEQHIPFDESNWAKAEQMIDASRTLGATAKSITVGKILAIAMLIGGVAVGSYFIFSSDEVETKKQMASNEIKSETIIANEILNPTVINEIDKEGTTAEKKSATKESPQLNLNKNNSSSIEVNSAAKEIMQSNSSQVIESSKSAAKSTIQSNDKANSFSGKEDNSTSNQLEKEQNSKLNGGIFTKAEATINNNVLAADNNSSVQKNENPIAEPMQENSTIAFKERIEFLNPIGFRKNEMDTNLLGSTYKYQKSYDDFNITGRTKIHSLTLGGGINYLKGWAGNNGTDGAGINLYAHLNYAYYVSRKISIGTGVDLYNIGNINQSYYDYERTQYSFGSNTTYTSVATNNLVYVSVPLSLSFDFNRIHSVSFGAMPSLLIHAANSVETYDMVEGIKTNRDITLNNGIYNDVAQKTLLLSMGYNFRINRNVKFNAQAIYGLTDMFANNTSNQNIQTPLGIRIGIKANLFEK